MLSVFLQQKYNCSILKFLIGDKKNITSYRVEFVGAVGLTNSWLWVRFLVNGQQHIPVEKYFFYRNYHWIIHLHNNANSYRAFPQLEISMVNNLDLLKFHPSLTQMLTLKICVAHLFVCGCLVWLTENTQAQCSRNPCLLCHIFWQATLQEAKSQGRNQTSLEAMRD